MPRPATRLLAFLELLQGSPFVAGREAAERLGVDIRTVRRYVLALHDLGIPVEGQRGVGGGYRLRPGYRLPPLMLSDDEAAAVVFGLVTTERLGLEAAERALAKVRRVLPPTLRRRVEALEASVAFTGAAPPAAPPSIDTLLVLTEGARRNRRVRLHYTNWAGESRVREVQPYGVVVHRGRWYVPGRDSDSGELRTFRVDRMRDAVLGAPAEPPPKGFDAVAQVARSLAQVPYRWRVEALVEAPLEELAHRIPATLAELDAADGGTLVQMRVDSLEWAAQMLAGLGRPFVVREPDELRACVRELADVLHASAERREGEVERAARAGSGAP